MSFVAREIWNAQRPKKITHLDAAKIVEVRVHYLGYKIAQRPNELVLIKSIQNHHMNVRGWNDIAYNVLAGHDDNYIGRGFHHRNAANRPYNARSVSICAILGTGQEPSDELLANLQKAIWATVELFPAIERIYPHSRMVKTRCPGTYLTRMIAQGAFTLRRPKPKGLIDLKFLDDPNLTPELIWARICGVRDTTILDRYSQLNRDGDIRGMRALYAEVMASTDLEWIQDTRTQTVPQGVVRHPSEPTQDVAQPIPLRTPLDMTNEQRDHYSALRGLIAMSSLGSRDQETLNERLQALVESFLS